MSIMFIINSHCALISLRAICPVAMCILEQLDNALRPLADIFPR